MRAKRGFYTAAVVTILLSSFQPVIYRLIWAIFAVGFLYAADRIKDVEREKMKMRDLTEIRMQKQMLEDWEASLGARYAFTMEQIAKTSEHLLSQLSTYVKDASPTRSAYLELREDE